MGLPKIDSPIYDLTFPTSGKTIRVRPFTVKEEKVLMIALESKDQVEIINAVKQIINNCLIDGDFNVDKAPFFEVDYAFIFLRAKSIGEAVGIKLTCNNVLDDGNKCGNIFKATMDVSNCEIVEDEVMPNDIKLSPDKGVSMKYPSYSAMKRIDAGNDIDRKINLIINSIDFIYDKNGVYSSKDHSKEELQEFVEGLTEENFRKLEAYVDNFPTFAVGVEATCPKCHFDHKVRYTDFLDFFL